MMRSVLPQNASERPADADMPQSTPRRERPVFRWLRVILITTVFAFGGYIWSAYQPNPYRAECILQYEREPQASAANGPVASELSTQEWYRTQDFLIASNTVAERVVQQLQLQRDHGFFGVGPNERLAKTQAEAAALLRERVTVTRVDGTRLVRIGVEDSSAKRAARIANAIAAKYLEKVLEDRVASTSRALGWLSEEMAQTNRQLSQTEGEMQNYLAQQDAPPLPIAERQAMLTNELKQLNQSLIDARVRRIELAATVAKLKSAERDNPFEIHTNEIDQNDQVKQLQAEYTTFTVRHHEAQAAQGADSQNVRSGDVRLIALRAQMRSVIDGVQRSAQSELTAAQNVEGQLQSLIERKSAAGRELQRQQLELGRLERARGESELLLKALRERSAAAGVANAAGAANAKMVEPAVRPIASRSSDALRNSGIGALLGLAFAAALKRSALSAAA